MTSRNPNYLWTTFSWNLGADGTPVYGQSASLKYTYLSQLRSYNFGNQYSLETTPVLFEDETRQGDPWSANPPPRAGSETVWRDLPDEIAHGYTLGIIKGMHSYDNIIIVSFPPFRLFRSAKSDRLLGALTAAWDREVGCATHSMR